MHIRYTIALVKPLSLLKLEQEKLDRFISIPLLVRKSRIVARGRAALTSKDKTCENDKTRPRRKRKRFAIVTFGQKMTGIRHIVCVVALLTPMLLTHD